MMPIRFNILEFPRTGCGVLGRRESECLSQCLICGSLMWAPTTDVEPECRCPVESGALSVLEEPQLAGSA